MNRTVLIFGARVLITLATLSLLAGAVSGPLSAQSLRALPDKFALTYNVTKTDVFPPVYEQYLRRIEPGAYWPPTDPQHWTVMLYGNGGRLGLAENLPVSIGGNRVYVWDGKATTEIRLPSDTVAPTPFAPLLVYSDREQLLQEIHPFPRAGVPTTLLLLRNAKRTKTAGGMYVTGKVPPLEWKPKYGPMRYFDVACMLEQTPEGLAPSSFAIAGQSNPRVNSVTMETWSFGNYTSLEGAPIPSDVSYVRYGSIPELRLRPLPYLPSRAELLSAIKVPGECRIVGVPDTEYDFNLTSMSTHTWPAEKFSMAYWIRPGEQVNDERSGNTPWSFNYQPGEGTVDQQARKYNHEHGQENDARYSAFASGTGNGKPRASYEIPAIAMSAAFICAAAALLIWRRRSRG